jgi:hypothetical protein
MLNGIHIDADLRHYARADLALRLTARIRQAPQLAVRAGLSC